MESRRKMAAVIAVTALLAGSCGMAVGSEPETVTETKTVTKEVEIVTVPEACTKALRAAEEVTDMYVEVSEIAKGYIDLIEPAAMAGFNQDAAALDRVTVEMDVLTERTNALAERAGPVGEEFRTNRDACDAAAGDDGD